MNSSGNKVVIWFSCGATSAVAAKMTVKHMSKDHLIKVVYCNTGSEHEDNLRFLCEVEDWIGHPIEVRRSEKYIDIWDVFEKTGWLVGVGGARCTTELKKRVRQDFEKEWWPDYQVFGFDAGERERAERFRKNNPEVRLITPLIGGDSEFDWCQNVDKATCLGMLIEAGIEVPAMYRLGFNNANCIGCVKGGMGYWNHVRVVFPKIFDRMVSLERGLGVAILARNETVSIDAAYRELRNDGVFDVLSTQDALKNNHGDTFLVDKKECNKVNVRRLIFLDELDPEWGKHEPQPHIDCDLLCGMMYDTIIGDSHDNH